MVADQLVLLIVVGQAKGRGLGELEDRRAIAGKDGAAGSSSDLGKYCAGDCRLFDDGAEGEQAL